MHDGGLAVTPEPSLRGRVYKCYRTAVSVSKLSLNWCRGFVSFILGLNEMSDSTIHIEVTMLDV